MARDTITVTNAVLAGVVVANSAPVAANNGEVANASGKVIVLVVNGLGGAAGGATQVTIQTVACPHERTQNAAAFTVAVDTIASFGPFPPLLYNQSDDTVQVDYDATAANIVVAGLTVL